MTILSIDFFKILMTSSLMFALYRGRKTIQKVRVLYAEKLRKRGRS